MLSQYFWSYLKTLFCRKAMGRTSVPKDVLVDKATFEFGYIMLFRTLTMGT